MEKKKSIVNGFHPLFNGSPFSTHGKTPFLLAVGWVSIPFLTGLRFQRAYAVAASEETDLSFHPLFNGSPFSTAEVVEVLTERFGLFPSPF